MTIAEAAPTLVANPAFAMPADRATIERAADALRAKGYGRVLASRLADLDRTTQICLSS